MISQRYFLYHLQKKKLRLRLLFHFKVLSFGGDSGSYDLHTAFIEFQIHKVTLTKFQCARQHKADTTPSE